MIRQGVFLFILVFLSTCATHGLSQTPSDTSSILSSFRQADSLINASKITEGKKLLYDVKPDLEFHKLWDAYFQCNTLLIQLETDFGNFDVALSLNKMAQKVIQLHNLQGTDHEYTTSLWHTNTLIKQNKHEQALAILHPLLEIARTQNTTLDSNVLHNLFSLAYSRIGKYSKALQHSLKTITHDSLLTAVNCFNTASFYDVLNDVEKRDEYLLKAHKLAQDKEGVRGIFEQINVLLYMANLAKDESNIGLAAEYANQAESLFERLPEENKRQYEALFVIIQRVQITVAMAYDNEKVVRQRMKIIKKYMTPDACFTFNGLSGYFGARGMLIEQDSFLELSRLCIETNNNNPVLIEFYEDAKLNDLFRKERYLECAEIAMKSLGVKHFDNLMLNLADKGLNKVQNLNSLHKLSGYFYHHYTQSKDDTYLMAAANVSHIVDSLSKDKIKDVTSKLSRYKYDNYFMLSHHIHAAKSTITNDVADLNRAIEKFERIRMYQQAKMFTGMLLKENRELKDVYKKEQSIIEDLNGLEKTLAQVSDSLKNKVIDQINDTKENLILVRRELKSQFPTYFNSIHQTSFPSIESIQSQMTNDQKVVTFCKKWDQLVIMEISQTDYDLHFTTLPRYFKSQLDSFVNGIKNRVNTPILHGKMKSIFIDPLELSGYSDITFITDPVMTAFPLELLIPGFVSPDDGSLPKTIRYAYSLTSWLTEATESQNDYLVALTSTHSSSNSTEKIDPLNSSREGHLPIPNTEKEVDAIVSLFKSNNVIQNPSKLNLKETLQGAGIIHFATHTVVNNENPSFSKLVFESPDDSDEENNVFLYEIPGLELQAQLVCLSSCNSGVGKYISGEGVSGLGQTFAYAGCANTVQSLWPVDDASTAKIMSLFYSNLKDGQSKPTALSNAKRQFVSEAPAVWKHPYFWAGFVYYGDDEPLHHSTSLAWPWIALGLIALASIFMVFLRNRRTTH